MCSWSSSRIECGVWSVNKLQLQLKKVYVDNRIEQLYDSWEDHHSKFRIVLYGKR